MKQEILQHFPWPWLPSVALLIFFSFFIIMIFRLLMKSRQSLLQRAARLPLDDAEEYRGEKDSQ